MGIPIFADGTAIPRAPWRRERFAPQFGKHLVGAEGLDRASRQSSSDFTDLPRPRIEFQS